MPDEGPLISSECLACILNLTVILRVLLFCNFLTFLIEGLIAILSETYLSHEK